MVGRGQRRVAEHDFQYHNKTEKMVGRWWGVVWATWEAKDCKGKRSAGYVLQFHNKTESGDTKESEPLTLQTFQYQVHSLSVCTWLYTRVGHTDNH